ncbi:MAG TPA: hypothetical protein VJZ71_20365 [Phycisphaerae bacterium]|nr:hypothetical protein [Phycisphaerae bacterium]
MDDSRQRIDPDGKYGADVLRTFEAFALTVLDKFPGAVVERTRDLIQIGKPDDDRAVVVLITPEAIEIRLPTLEWPHPHVPAPSSRLWKRLNWEGLTDKRLTRLLEEAAAARAAEFATCRFCGESFPPESRDGADVCHGCAEEHLGVVH